MRTRQDWKGIAQEAYERLGEGAFPKAELLPPDVPLNSGTWRKFRLGMADAGLLLRYSEHSSGLWALSHDKGAGAAQNMVEFANRMLKNMRGESLQLLQAVEDPDELVVKLQDSGVSPVSFGLLLAANGVPPDLVEDYFRIVQRALPELKIEVTARLEWTTRLLTSGEKESDA